MNANQFRAAIAKLGLSQRKMARLLGVDDKTSHRWAKKGVPGATAILLRLLVAGKITIEDIQQSQRNVL